MTYLHSHMSPSSPKLQPVQFRWPDPRYPEACGLPAGEPIISIAQGILSKGPDGSSVCHPYVHLLRQNFRRVLALAFSPHVHNIPSISVKLQAWAVQGL